MLWSSGATVCAVVTAITTAACAVPVLAGFTGAGFGLWFEVLVALSFTFTFMTVTIGSNEIAFLALNALERVMDHFAVFTVDVWADTIT